MEISKVNKYRVCFKQKSIIAAEQRGEAEHRQARASHDLLLCSCASFTAALFTSVQPVQFSCSVMPDSATPWAAACQALPIHYQPPEFTQTHVH